MEEEASRQGNDRRDTARTRLIGKKREWLSSWKLLSKNLQSSRVRRVTRPFVSPHSRSEIH